VIGRQGLPIHRVDKQRFRFKRFGYGQRAPHFKIIQSPSK